MRVKLGRSAVVSGVVAALALGHPVRAQDAGTYSLPSGSRPTAPAVQGPVDPENPVVAPRNPRDEATPAPAPSASPRIVRPAPTATLTPSPTPTRTPSRARTPAEPAPRPTPTVTPSPQAEAPSPAPTATPVEPPSPTLLPAEPTPTPSATPTEPAASEETGSNTPFLVGGLVVLLLAAGAVLLRKRRRSGRTPSGTPAGRETVAAAPVAPQPPHAAPPPRPAAPLATSPRPAPAPVPPASPAAEPMLAASDDQAEALPLAIAYRPQAIRLSLVFATLAYELDVTNAGPAPTPELELRADLSSAHAAIPVHEQLAPTPASLERKQTLAPLAPGETARLKGEVRLPLQDVHSLVKGAARFFVPLARFGFVTPDHRLVRRVYTVGPVTPGSEALASVRLDAGPRNLRELAAREIEAARAFALDPAPAAG